MSGKRNIRLERLFTKEFLHKNYIVEDKTATQISKENNCSSQAVLSYLKRRGIAKKGKGKSYKWPQLSDPQWLHEQYVELDKSAIQIAKEIGCDLFDQNIVLRQLRKYNIKVDASRSKNVKTKVGDKYEYREALQVCRKKGKRSEVRVQFLCHNCGQKSWTSSSEFWRNSRCRKCYRTLSGPGHHNWKGFGEITGSYWNSVNHGAVSRGFKISITLEDAWNKFIEQERKCALTGQLLYFELAGRNIGSTASLDRIDSSKCYVKGNIQWLHKHINLLKSNLDEDFFISLCQQVAEHHTKQIKEGKV